jgi:hypothetical protein
MNEDYLWDGSGEPDPEIENLEQLLGKYRYTQRPLELPARPTRRIPLQLAAAAAIVLMVLAGLWVMRSRSTEAVKQPMAEVTQPEDKKVDDAPALQQLAVNPPAIKETVTRVANRRVAGKSKPEEEMLVDTPAGETDAEIGIAFDLDAEESGDRVALLDTETTRHIERAQILLRTVKNAPESSAGSGFDIGYEKKKSREMVYKNIVLRRGAESRSNMPVEDLLAGLEPLLIDIANLPARPSRDDLHAIKERIEKTGMITTLQVYSGAIASRNFKMNEGMENEKP